MIRATLAVVLLAASPVLAQDGRQTVEADMLRDLPTSDNLYQLLETTQPSVISDRFSGGGLFAGQAARIGGFFGSSSQTMFRLDGVSIDDPSGSGGPLPFPDLAMFRRVHVTTGMMPLTANALGLSVTLDPIEPTDRWVHTLAGSFSNGPFAGHAPPKEPAVARLERWDRLSAIATGPLTTGLGGAFAVSWNRSAQFTRSDPAAAASEQGSAFARLVFTPNTGNEVRTTGWLQRSTYPSDLRRPLGRPDTAVIDESGHVQALWDHRRTETVNLQLSGSYTERRRTPVAAASTRIVFERLLDGPVDALSAAGPSLVRRWSLGVGARSADTSHVHTFLAGIEFGGARAEQGTLTPGPVGEVVNGIPARVWLFQQPARSSLRRSSSVLLHANDRVRISPSLSVEGGLALDTVSGSARGGGAILWQTLLPRTSFTWTLSNRWVSAVFSGYRRSAYQLPLDALAVGDPGALSADVYRWDAGPGLTPSLALVGPLVARVGPGSGGNPAFSRIDPDLKRPYLDELVIGMESHPMRDVTVRLTSAKRRERSVMGVVNTSVTRSSYTSFGIPDPGANVWSTADDRIVPVFNRMPASFGLDAYLLTNPVQDDSTSESVELSVQLSKRRVFAFVGGTASRTNGQAANRGYGPLENDEGILGELFTTPNAETYARGRLFNDRAYTGKAIAVFHLPREVHLGILARYQDGQPFARVHVVTGLNQGTEAVRAYANGDSRFMFVGTLDLRVQKRLSIGRAGADLILDVYNVPDMRNETEEDVVDGAGFRTVTAIQPPRTFQLGVRVTF